MWWNKIDPDYTFPARRFWRVGNLLRYRIWGSAESSGLFLGKLPEKLNAETRKSKMTLLWAFDVGSPDLTEVLLLHGSKLEDQDVLLNILKYCHQVLGTEKEVILNLFDLISPDYSTCHTK